jgi:hypothetical protein
MEDTDSAKRIPKTLGTEAKLFGRYTLSDVAVALLPAVVVVLLLQVVIPSTAEIAGYHLQSLLLPFVGLSILIGALFVYLTPAYTTSIDWFSTFIGFHRSEKHLDHETARQYTQISRIHPEAEAIERIDGAFIGMVRVEPPTMALATDEEWAANSEAFMDFCNTTIQFPIQLYSTTQPFPVTEYLKHYQDRLSDADVRDNPNLDSLIRSYIEWYERDLDERRMTIRDHYVIVAVSPTEVQFEDNSLLDNVASLPFIGGVVRHFFGPRRSEIRAVMAETLRERLRDVESGIREIRGCSATVVGAHEAAGQIADFWSETDEANGNMAQKIRTLPLIGGPQ